MSVLLTRAVLNVLIFKLLVMRTPYLPGMCWYLNYLFIFIHNPNIGILGTLVFCKCMLVTSSTVSHRNITFHADLLDSFIPPDVFTYVVLVYLYLAKAATPVQEYMPPLHAVQVHPCMATNKLLALI